MLPKRLKFYQAYDIGFGNMADKYKDLYIQSTYMGNASVSSGSGSGSKEQILNSVMDFGMMAAMMGIAAKSSKNEQSAQASAQTQQLINNYSNAQFELSTVQGDLKTKREELATLNDQKTAFKTKDADIQKLDGELKSLNEKYNIGVDDKGEQTNTNYAEYQKAQTKLDTLNKAKTQLKPIETQLSNAEKSFEAASNASFETRGQTAKSIKSTGGQSAENQISEDNYKTIPVKDEKTGKPTGQYKTDTATFKADQAKARQLDSDYNAKKAEVDRLKGQKQTILAGAGVPEGSNIDAAIESAQAEVNRLGANNSLNGSDGSSITIASYEGQKSQLEKQISDLKKLDDKQIDKDIAATEKEIKALEAKEKEAQKKVDFAKKALSGMTSAVANADSASATLNTEKGEYEKSKTQAGKNGKTLTWFQRLMGTNKSATQKGEKADYKAAKSANKQAQATLASYGLTEAQIEELRKYGLVDT